MDWSGNAESRSSRKMSDDLNLSVPMSNISSLAWASGASGFSLHVIPIYPLCAGWVAFGSHDVQWLIMSDRLVTDLDTSENRN